MSGVGEARAWQGRLADSPTASASVCRLDILAGRLNTGADVDDDDNDDAVIANTSCTAHAIRTNRRYCISL